MDQKEEFENMIRDADQSREKSLILLICVSKSLLGLQGEFKSQEFDEEQTIQLNQLLDCVDNITDLWLTKLNEGKVTVDELIELIEESDLLNVFVNLFYHDLTVKFTKIEQILHKIFSNLPIAKDNQTPFYLYLMTIAQRFKEENGLEKFLLSEKLNVYLCKNLSFCLENEKVKNCIKILADSIYDVLQNKLSEELRSPIFNLVATITYHYENLDWFIKNGDERRSFLLVSRLACIESIMCLKEKIDGINLLTSSLIIVEHSIKSLIEEEETECENKTVDKSTKKGVMNYLKNDDVIGLIDAIKLSIQSIVLYLVENQNLLNQFELNENEMKDSKSNYHQFQVCLRVLCLYLTFENEFLKEDFEKIITLISQYILNELNQTDRNNNLINLALNSLISIMDNDSAKYKDQLIKLNLISTIESQVNKSKEKSEVEMYKSFLDSISNY